MSHVVIEKHGFQLEVRVDDIPVLETGLDLTGTITLELWELVNLLEEVSDDLVEYLDLED